MKHMAILLYLIDMENPRIKLPVKRKAVQPEETPLLTISNPRSLPQEVKDSLLPAKGAIQQMIDQYIGDTLLYLRSGGHDKQVLIRRGESLKSLLKGLNSPPAKISPDMYNYPNKRKIKR